MPVAGVRGRKHVPPDARKGMYMPHINDLAIPTLLLPHTTAVYRTSKRHVGERNPLYPKHFPNLPYLIIKIIKYRGEVLLV